MKLTKKLVCLIMSTLMGLSIGIFVGCGEKNPADVHVEGSAGLTYRLSEDGSHYIWAGITAACTDKDVVVGNWHENLPVTECLSSLERSDDENFRDMELNSITISAGITTLAFGCLNNKYIKKAVLPDGIEIYPQALMLFETQLEEFVIGKGLKEMDVDILMQNEMHLKTIYFRGTQAEWEAVEIAEKGNDDILGCTNIVFNYKG